MGGKRLLARCAVLAVAVPLFAVGGNVSTASAQDGRIVGGTPVTHNNYEFMASLRGRWGSHFCGGTLIAPRWVLTASHCVDRKRARDVSVVVGSTTLNSEDNSGISRTVSRILMHPSYGKPVQYANDAALLELSSAITNHPTIPVAEAVHDSLEAENHTLTTAGWGTTSEGGSCCPNRMNEVDVPVVSDASCKSSYGNSFDPATMVCAGLGGKDSCQGDSGGPLFNKSNPLVQLGTVSWGNGCARSGYPGVYGELNNSGIREWIRTNASV